MTDEGFYDAGDQAAVDNAGKEAARREAQDKETIRIWMSHANGRDLLWRFLGLCHIRDSCVGATVEATYLLLGERNIGNWWQDRLMQHPELYMKMVNEAQIEEEARQIRLQKQNEQKAQRDGYDTSSFE